MSDTTLSSAVASPWISTAPGLMTPLRVGSEYNRLTFGLRRIFNAFCGNPILVHNKNRPSLINQALTGHVCGEPSRNSVVNSHVR